MAIAFRSSTSIGGTGGTATITKPSGTASGDLLVAFIAIQAPQTIATVPTGWTQIAQTGGSGSPHSELSTYYLMAGASEPANYSWTYSGTGGFAAWIGSYTGVSTTPLDSNGVSDTTNTAPSLSAGFTGELLVCGFVITGNLNNGGWSTTPSGMTSRTSESGTGNNQATSIDDTNGAGNWFVSMNVSDQVLAATGATGTKTASNSTVGGTNPCSQSVLFYPTGAGGSIGGFTGGTTDTYNATTTWTVPSVAVNGYDVTSVNVNVWGGGGGGGASSATSGGGGGGGGGFSGITGHTVTPGETITITVGAASAAGGAGNQSWFRNATTVQANGGGAGGAGGTLSGGSAGAAAAVGTGTTKFGGGAGAAGNATTTGGAGGGGAGTTGAGGAAATTTAGSGTSVGGGAGGSPTGPVAPSANGGGGYGGTALGSAAVGGARGQVMVNYLRQWKPTRSETTGTQPAADSITRAFVGARTQTETQTLTATPTRVFTANRLISETVTAANDTKTRQFVGARTITESLTLTDAVTRVFTGARTQTETQTVSDTPTRVFTASRTISETVTAASATVTRIAQFNRLITETQTLTDSPSRAVAAARTQSESVGAATATVTRIATYNRIIGEGPGDYPANNGQKSITGTVKDQATGSPISGVTVYLIRSTDLVYTGRSTTTNVSGQYTFLRDFGDANQYLVLVETDGGSPPRHGVSDSGIVPV